MCIFLLKFHCGLNLIEFFWGCVKKYLQGNCDYTFNTLKTNLPITLASVSMNTIHLWEHQLYRWMDAYHLSLNTRSAQLQVKQFST